MSQELNARVAQVMKHYPDAYITERGVCVKQSHKAGQEEVLLFWRGLDTHPMFAKESSEPEEVEESIHEETLVDEEETEKSEETPKKPGRKPKSKE